MKRILLYLLFSFHFSFSSFAQGLPVKNITKFFDALSSKDNGWNGYQFEISENDNGQLEVVKSEGGYGFDQEYPRNWSYGFGFCTLAEESMCSDGFGWFKIQNGQLYVAFIDEEIKVNILKSTPTELRYILNEKTAEGNVTYRIQLKLTKSKTFIFHETAHLNGEHKWTSVFQGR